MALDPEALGPVVSPGDVPVPVLSPVPDSDGLVPLPPVEACEPEG